MTSFPLSELDEASRTELADLQGARIDAASFVADTGLVTLVLYQARKVLLGAGIGPVVQNIGLLPRLPQKRAGAEHPLVAAIRAHLVGLHIRSIQLDESTLWITTDPPISNEGEPAALPARLALDPGRCGAARVIAATGSVVVWPTEVRPMVVGRPLSLQSLDVQGAAMVDASDLFLVEAFRRELLLAVKKKLKRFERRSQAVEQDLARLDDVPHLQKLGGLLLSQGQNIPKGTTKATLFDWASGDPIDVELRPDKPAKEQAAGFFQKARRIDRGAQAMWKRLEETTQSIESIRPFVDMLQNAPADWNHLQQIASRMHSVGIATVPATSSNGKRQVSEERKPYHVFRCPSGQTILVGRSSKDNDELVTKVAKPHDLWLHAKNTRGAHVVVPLQKNRTCPADVLVDAATLAAHFSEARNETMCEVTYVDRRYVRKPKKSAPGMVTVDREKIIVVRIEPERLSRLLGAKEDA